MFKKFLHFIFSFPWAYNQMQVFFGANTKKHLVLKHYPFINNREAVILDLGGGTGLYRDLWPKNYRYICLDLDAVKLGSLIKDYPDGDVLIADAGRIPFKDQSVDAVFCSSLSHHITEDHLDALLTESARVLKASGRLLFLDAVRRDESFLNRLLWALDKGGHPHTTETLQGLVQKHFTIERSDEFSRYYDFILLMATKKA